MLASQLKLFMSQNGLGNCSRMLIRRSDLQDVPIALMIAVTTYHSSRGSSLMRLDPTSACLLRSCRDSGMKS